MSTPGQTSETGADLSTEKQVLEDIVAGNL